MKRIVLITISLAALLALGFTYAPEKLMDPALLAKMIKNNSPEKPIIINVGPSGPIKGSVLIGSTEDPANQTRLKEYLKKLPKDTKVVIYCGCCKLEDCHNIFEATKILNAMGSNYQIVNMPTDFSTDWLTPGYPME